MDLDFGKFYTYLTENGDSSGAFVGKTFKDIATTPWFYIPFATDNKDFGPTGKGSGNVKICVRENGAVWDAFLLKETSTAATKAVSQSSIDKVKAARAERNSVLGTKEEGMSMEKLMSLSEAYLSGKDLSINEASEGADDKGDVAMLGNASYTVFFEKVGMSFEEVLKACVGMVTGKPVENGDTSLMAGLKA